ncbi:DEAD/DEAH box helicase [Frigidibacter sp. MR17.14]|uniref:DEAD/DEAH box helicase n=1 Tax=Frigidibacter sp. MR17.14 TaxID=3126509 RepID=UPI003012ABE8
MKQTLRTALEARGYTTLTPVQEVVSGEALAGKDLLVSAQTGSGKTVGFGLAIAPEVLGEGETFGIAAAPLALVIAPTRELALQVKRELGWLYAGAGVTIASTVGGMDARAERRALIDGAHILVATPGRLCDHLRRGSVDLSELRAVVLDEADEMLDLGFREDLETILAAAPEGRRTLLFSATVSPEIEHLARTFQRDAQRIVVETPGGKHADIAYHAVLVADRDEENAITNLLRFHEAPNAIVFANTRAAVSRLVSRLSNRGFPVVALSGELSQQERSHALQAMRDGRARVCVATDVAARGIDLPNLDLVIHAELPLSEEALLHRSGRTGRAGRKGISALIVPPRAIRRAERTLKAAKLEALWEPAPSAEAVTARDDVRLLDDAVWGEAATEAEAATVAQLLAQKGPEAAALAMVRLWRGQRSAPEDLEPVAPRPAPSAGFGASVWFSLPIGRERNASPKWIMPKVCDAGGITRREIGAIRIGAEESFVEVAAEVADQMQANLGPSAEIAEGLPLTRMAGPPSAEDVGPAPRKTFGAKGGKPWAKGPRREFDGPAKPWAKGPRPERAEGESKPWAKGPRPERAEGEARSWSKGPRPERAEGEGRSWSKGPRPEGDTGYKGKPAPKAGAKPGPKPAAKYRGGDNPGGWQPQPARKAGKFAGGKPGKGFGPRAK